MKAMRQTRRSLVTDILHTWRRRSAREEQILEALRRAGDHCTPMALRMVLRGEPSIAGAKFRCTYPGPLGRACWALHLPPSGTCQRCGRPTQTATDVFCGLPCAGRGRHGGLGGRPLGALPCRARLPPQEPAAVRVYISGPMSGLPFNNHLVFDTVAKRLRALGHDVVNPAELDRASGRPCGPLPEETYREVLRADIRHLMECDAVCMLPGWQNSRGAQAEEAVARGLGMVIWYPGAAIPAAEQQERAQ